MNNVAVCSTTFYPKWEDRADKLSEPRRDNEDNLRGDLAIATIKTVVEKGYQLLVVDGGSPEAFRKAVLEVCGDSVNFRPQKERGLGPSRQQAFAEAGELSGVERIAFTLAERLDFAHRGLDTALAAFEERNLDMMLVGRQSLDSLPDRQAESERRCHRFIDGTLTHFGILDEAEKGKWDWFSGYHFFKNTPQVQAVLAKRYGFTGNPEKYPLEKYVNPDLYSNALYFPLVHALNSSEMSVGTMKVDYIHPKEMKDFEESGPDINLDRRKIQRAEICISFLHYARMLKGNDSGLSLQK